MTQLPPCKFRGQILDNDMVECSCPSLMHHEEGRASVATCLHPCPFRDEAVLAAKKESPPLYVKAMNYLSALTTHAIAGFPVASPEDYKKRLDTCMACDVKHPVRMECTHPNCGCNIEDKAAWADQECPLKKWLKVEGVKRAAGGCGGCGKG